MNRSRRPLTFLGALLIVAALLPAGATTVAAVGASVPAGFQDDALFTGLNHPMAVAYAPAPSTKIFVAEKRGTILEYDSAADTTPTVFADLNLNVHNYWDRGLMSLVVDPGYSTGRPFVYVLYDYNHILGDPAPAPRWPSADALVPPGSVYDDRCTNPPQGAVDGCVISGRLSQLRSDGASSGPKMTGPEHVLVEDWCQQFPSHSLGTVMFGADGALYASAGEGASFNATTPDYGQLGGTLPNTPTPSNPCGDPGGTHPTPPTAEGGSLRAQDIRTTGDPTGLDGAIIRVDPDTGAAWSTNYNTSRYSDLNARRIVGYGLRNPFRFTIKPGTNDLWVGDVGFQTWEELDHLPNPTAAPLNFGWPCWEGDAVLPFFNDLGLNLCSSLAAASVTKPYYTYDHASSVVSGDGCGVGSSSISGVAFLPASSGYPSAYRNGLFFTDYARKCIWFMPPGAGGNPDASAIKLFANLARSAPDTSGGAVFLTVSPGGDLVYADYDRGEIRTVHYYGVNVPPVASFTATPGYGATLPLHVDFDARGSSDANGQPLTYEWDLDGNGTYEVGPTTNPQVSMDYPTAGNVVVGLRVSDNGSPALSDTTTRTVSVGNTPPTVHIDTPASSLTWNVNDVIHFTGSATDAEDGPLPPSDFVWTLTIRHCPSDCHSHLVQTYTGVDSGDMDGPDHEYPSHLLLSVTVTDSGGLTATDTIALYPNIGTVSATTSPAGIPITVGTAAGAPPPAATGIVGSQVSVTAPATATIGEGIWTFDHWSDDQSTALTHPVAVVQGPTTVTGQYVLTGHVDRPDTCSASPPAVAPSGAWMPGSFGKAADVDWYRFSLTRTTRVRIALGDLTTGGRLDLYSGCSTLLQTSDRGGNGAEEIIRSLPAGTYAVKATGSGSGSAPAYAVLIKSMPNSVHILSSRAIVEGSTLRLVGELYNNTTRSVGSVKVTARIYSSSDRLLATRTAYADLSYVPPTGRTPFRIVGPLPAGYDHVSWMVSAPATSRAIGAPSPVSTSSGPDAGGHWHVAGTVRNPYSGSISTLRVAVTLYDSRGNILDATRASVGATSLGAGRSTTFSAVFIPAGLTPDRVYVRGMLFR